MLFRIDPRPFEAALRQAQAVLARDEAQAANAQRDADRYKALVEKDYVTKSQADQAAVGRGSRGGDGAGRPRRGRQRASSTSTTRRSSADRRADRTAARPPGQSRQAERGPARRHQQLRPILVRFPVVQHDFPCAAAPVRQGERSRARRDGGQRASRRSGNAGVSRQRRRFADGTVTAKARFENQSNGLWPGEYVRVSVELSDAVQRARRADARGDGRPGRELRVRRRQRRVAKVRPITVGRAVGDMTTIDKGVAIGEQVVVDGQSRLTPNARVDVKPAAKQARGGSK